MENTSGIQRAVDLKGSPRKLAEAVGNGVLRQHVDHWLKVGRVSAERAPDVFAVTGVPLEQLNDRVNWDAVRRAKRRSTPATQADPAS